MGLNAPSGDIIFEIEIPVTFFQSGANYFARYGAITILRGNSSSFTIVPGVGAVSDTITSTSFIFNANIHTFYQTVTQPGGQRIFPSLIAGLRSIGGGQSANAPNNSRTETQIGLNGIQPGNAISSTINWSGGGTLTINNSVLNITFKGN